jgi:hypothetical protein
MKPDHSLTVRLSWFLLIVILYVLLSTVTLAQPQRIGPAPPILQYPAEGLVARLSYPGNVDLTFGWQPGEGGQAPTRFLVCVAELGQACSAPSAWVFPVAGAPPITSTSYRARLPAAFQGKRLQWTVAACAPSPLPAPAGGRDICSYAAPRRLDWPLPAPALGLPAGDVSASLRPTFTVEVVPGAEWYLFCLARPGTACPTEATHQPGDKIEGVPDAIVAEVRQASHYAPPNDLEQYRSRLMLWSAAACNAAMGCTYQAPRYVTLVDISRLTCIERANEVEIRNARYVARLPRAAGSFTLARLPSGQQAVMGDTISLRLGGSPTWITDARLADQVVAVEKCHDFYARVRVEGSLSTSPWGPLQVARTYEFTRSPHIYEQLELRFHGTQVALPIRELVWQLSLADPGLVRVAATTDDFVVRYPTLGSSHPPVPGVVLPCIPKPECAGPSRSINLQHSGNPSPGVDLLREQVLLANRAISLAGGPGSALDYARFRYAFSGEDGYQFYAGFGIRGADGALYDFNNWDSFKYAIEDVSPVPLDEASRQTEDWIVRLAMFAVDQLAEDDGWWRTHEWTGGGGVRFPRGDRFTDDARSFPALAYVWVHLALRQTRRGWQHFPADADAIYRQLQETYPWYLESDPTVSEITPNPAHNFADRSPSGTRYLSYSQHLKERYGPNSPRTVKGVINAHGTALKWAWIMAEASRLFGDTTRESDWHGVVTRYHPGSREMLDLAYPDPRFFGLIPYQRDQQLLPDDKMAYIDHAFLGIAAGYEATTTFEPEFADIVERASRLNTDPFDDVEVAWASSPYPARLWRLFPAALAFARPEELNAGGCSGVAPPSSLVEWGSIMSGTLHAASLTEVLEYDRDRPLAVHDPGKYISEGSGRKWILTNTRFQTYWSPGFWEEVDRASLPVEMLFDIKVTLPPPASRSCVGEHYAAYRTDNKIFIMTDYSGGSLTLEIPVWQTPQAIKRRLYNTSTGRWGAEQALTGVQFGPGPGGKTVVNFGDVRAKALVIVEIRP